MINNLEKKYFVVKSLMLANGLTFITGQKPFIYNSNFEDNKHVYSFINTYELQEALKIMNEAMNRLKK